MSGILLIDASVVFNSGLLQLLLLCLLRLSFRVPLLFPDVVAFYLVRLALAVEI